MGCALDRRMCGYPVLGLDLLHLIVYPVWPHVVYKVHEADVQQMCVRNDSKLRVCAWESVGSRWPLVVGVKLICNGACEWNYLRQLAHAILFSKVTIVCR